MGHFHCCSTCFVLYNFFSLIMATNFFFFNQGLILLSYSRLYSVESCFFSYDLLLFQFHVYQCVCFTLRNINVLHRNWVCWAELNALMFFPNILNYFLLKLSFLLSLYCRAASLFFLFILLHIKPLQRVSIESLFEIRSGISLQLVSNNNK